MLITCDLSWNFSKTSLTLSGEIHKFLDLVDSYLGEICEAWHWIVGWVGCGWKTGGFFRLFFWTFPFLLLWADSELRFSWDSLSTSGFTWLSIFQVSRIYIPSCLIYINKILLKHLRECSPPTTLLQPFLIAANPFSKSIVASQRYRIFHVTFQILWRHIQPHMCGWFSLGAMAPMLQFLTTTPD